MKTNHLLIATTVLCCFIAVSNTCTAQDVSAAEIEPVDETVQIDFPGGTISEYVQLLRTLKFVDSNGSPHHINVVVTESAEDYVLPSIQVRTDAYGALSVMAGCSSQSTEVHVDGDESGTIDLVRVIHHDEMQVTVLNVKHLVQNLDKESLLSAIEIGLEMHDSGSQVTIKLHQETGLLFVKGPKTATGLVSEIASELYSSIHDVNRPRQPSGFKGPNSRGGGGGMNLGEGAGGGMNLDGGGRGR